MDEVTAMSVTEIAAKAAEALNEDEALAAQDGFRAIAEDEGDPVFEVERAMGESGVLAVVSADGFERRARSGATLVGTARIRVTVLENVPLNRPAGNAAALTAWRAAERNARILHWRDLGLESPLRLGRMERADADGVARVSMDFAAEAVLGG